LPAQQQAATFIGQSRFRCSTQLLQERSGELESHLAKAIAVTGALGDTRDEAGILRFCKFFTESLPDFAKKCYKIFRIFSYNQVEANPTGYHTAKIEFLMQSRFGRRGLPHDRFSVSSDALKRRN